MQRALGRRVELLGRVRFSLFTGPGFSVDRVIIHEDPAIGLEPMVYIQKDPGRHRGGAQHLVVARRPLRHRLHPADRRQHQPGEERPRRRTRPLEFQLVRQPLGDEPGAGHPRARRPHQFQVRRHQVGLLPHPYRPRYFPARLAGAGLEGGVLVDAGAHRPFGAGPRIVPPSTAAGTWHPNAWTWTSSWTAPASASSRRWCAGKAAACTAPFGSRLHLGGPIHNIGIQGRLNIQDVHRWDLLPGQGRDWPLDIRGRLGPSRPSCWSCNPPRPPTCTPPFWVRFRAGRLPDAAALGRGRQLESLSGGAAAWNWRCTWARSFRRSSKLSGTLDGALGYSGQGSLQGEVAFHNAALTIPDSPPLRAEEAHIVFDHGVVRLTPAVVRTADLDEARMQAYYDLAEDTLDLAISTDVMKVASLRSQVALAAVPWMEQVRSGQWSGRLRLPSRRGRSRLEGRPAIAATLAWKSPAWPTRCRLPRRTPRSMARGWRSTICEAQTGPLAFTGDYRYEPGAARAAPPAAAPGGGRCLGHRGGAGAGTLVRGGLIARALGRTRLPAWLKQWNVDGSIQIDDLTLAGSHLQAVRAHVLWDGGRVELDGLQARLDQRRGERPPGGEFARRYPQLQVDRARQGAELAIRQSGCRGCAGNLRHGRAVSGQPDVGWDLHRIECRFRSAHAVPHGLRELQFDLAASHPRDCA